MNDVMISHHRSCWELNKFEREIALAFKVYSRLFVPKIEVYSNSALYSGDGDSYSNATLITNREYEEQQQEIKRQIRLLDPRYVEDFTEEYITLMNETSI